MHILGIKLPIKPKCLWPCSKRKPHKQNAPNTFRIKNSNKIQASKFKHLKLELLHKFMREMPIILGLIKDDYSNMIIYTPEV